MLLTPPCALQRTLLAGWSRIERDCIIERTAPAECEGFQG